MTLRILLLLLLALTFGPDTARAAEPVCGLPTTIFCEDWEGANPLGAWPTGLWFENNQPQNHAITTTPANVYSGTHALETTWSTAQGGSGAGWLTRWFNANGNDATPLTGYDHVFARVYVKYEAGLQCDQNCPKLFVLNGNKTDNAYSSFGQAGTCPDGTNWFYAGTAQRQPPPSGNRDLIFYDYDAAMPCPPGAFGQEINMTPTQTIPLDTWTCIESEVQTNTVGQSNGIHRTWVNDVLAGQRTNVRWRDTTNLKLNSFQLSFSGGVLAGANHIWYDNIVVSQQRIGCAIVASGVPSPPTGAAFGQFYYLNVAKAGTGTGTVTGTGISCGADCVEPLAPNTIVPLTATPSAGSTFGGWSGACSGSGACNVTMSAAQNVTATFTASGGGTPIFDEDFEGTASGFYASGIWQPAESINFPSSLMNLTTAQRFTGSQSLQMVFTDVNGTATSQVVAKNTPALENFFFRYMIKVSSGFQIGSNGLTKHIELGGLSMAPVWTIEMETPSLQIMWLIDPWDPATPTFRASTGASIADGAWHCIEGQALMNAPGVANGEIRIWVDSVSRYTRTGLQLRGPSPGSSNATGIIGSTASFNFHKVYQQSGLGTMWMDRFAVGATRIGCP